MKSRIWPQYVLNWFSLWFLINIGNIILILSLLIQNTLTCHYQSSIRVTGNLQRTYLLNLFLNVHHIHECRAFSHHWIKKDILSPCIRSCWGENWIPAGRTRTGHTTTNYFKSFTYLLWHMQLHTYKALTLMNTHIRSLSTVNIYIWKLL